MKGVRKKKIMEDDTVVWESATCNRMIRSSDGTGEKRECGAPMKIHRKKRQPVCTRGGQNCGTYFKKERKLRRPIRNRWGY